MNKAEILVIDDEDSIRKLLEITLESNDYKVKQATNGKEGLLLAANHPPDLIILDLGLPDMNGHEVLNKLREWYFKSIIILSVENDEQNIVSALDNGASDYLTKPFRTGELLARIRTLLKRNNLKEDAQKININELEIDLQSRTVKIKNEELKLTATEFNLLLLMARNEGKVLTHQYLLKEIWGLSFAKETQYLRVFIAQLRKKIESNPNSPKYIITLSGIGYRFN